MTDDYVLDASALALALIGKSDSARTLRQRLPAIRRHAPHLIDAEVGNVLRRHEMSGRISTDEAQAALVAGGALVEYRYPHTGSLAQLAWKLRANVSFYDALYVALAVRLGVPLITADARLSKTPALECRIEVV